MNHPVRRLAAIAGAGLALAVVGAAPAFAATTTISASASNGIITVPASTNLVLGDTLAFTNTNTTQLGLIGDSTCGGGGGQNYGLVGDGQVVTIGTFSTPTFSAGQTLPFSISALGLCQPFSVVLTNAPPPPDVPEAPYAIAIGGAAVALLGGGLFVTRRRRARVA